MPPVIKPTIPTVAANFTDMLHKFSFGKLFIGDGGYSKQEADAAFATLESKEEELNAKFISLSDVADNPGKIESKVEKLKTYNYIIEGKRTNSIEINLVGVNAERKIWLEEQLNRKNRTIVLESKDKGSVLIFNSMRWSCEWTHEIDGFFNSVIGTEYSGPSTTGYMIYTDIQGQY